MSRSTLLPAILFGLVGAWLILLVFGGMLRALSLDLRGVRSKMKIASASRLVALVDEHMNANRHKEAISAIQGAFLIDESITPGQVNRVAYEHNVSLLGKLLAIAEKRGGHFPNLDIIEGLFHARMELINSIGDSIESQANLKKERAAEGKALPAWAQSEHSKKLAELRDKLKSNARSIEGLLKDAVGSINNMSDPNQITYH